MSQMSERALEGKLLFQKSLSVTEGLWEEARLRSSHLLNRKNLEIR